MDNNDLNDLSVFALRDFARKIGVKSPTSKTKAQIIQEITDIKSGKIEPNFSLTRHGRPPKSTYLQQEEPPRLTNNFREIVFNQPIVVEDTEKEKTAILNGFVEVINKNSAVLWNFDNFAFVRYYIPSEVCYITPLKTGDFVICELVMQERQLIVKRVLNINGIPILKLEKQNADFNKLTAILPEKSMEFTSLKLNVKYGQNVYLFGADNNTNSLSSINLIADTVKAARVYINISMLEKDLIFLQPIKLADLFVAKLTDNLDYIKQVLNLAVERIKRLIENKNNVVVLIDDLTTLMENPELEPFAKTFLSLTRATKRSGSITTFSIVDENTKYKKLADACFKIKSLNEFEKTN